jgi:2-isopropylmalate synthase
VDASDGERSWTTVGSSVNIIEASFQALLDSLELPLLRRASQQETGVAMGSDVQGREVR